MFSATGLRTYIWNNNLKTGILLIMFPVLVAMFTYAGLLIEQGWWLLRGKPYGRGLNDLEFVGVGVNFWDMLTNQLMIAAERLPSMVPYVLIAVGVWFFIAYFVNVKMISSATGAKAVTRQQEPELYNLLENLCISRGMRMPKLQVMETRVMNAYAAGVSESQYTIAVTRGLLNGLTRDEVEAVLAHELAHIQHRDVRLMMVTTVFVGVFSLVLEIIMNAFSNNSMPVPRFKMSGGGSSSGGKGGKNAGGMIAVAIVLIIIALIILALVKFLGFLTQMAISRTREFMADAQAAILTQNPEAMISALQKISRHSEMRNTPDDLRAMFIDNPMSSFGDAFSTHPSIKRRVQRLAHYSGLLQEQRATAA
jgi:heat shock protein HtpX